ncbi:hypothetical protein AB1K70_05285 [Bremerella sp. JC770]|uniref:hypothetical protein n=1 Tax=Bremerella sp. JC770 TaxID=3232137 RepID=UPI00345A0A1F
MPTEFHVIRQGQKLLVGIGLDNAVLDFVTTCHLLVEALRVLEEPHQGLVSCQLGSFGIYSVTLNLHQDDSVSIYVDGPAFASARNESVGIWLQKEKLHGILAEALKETTAD